MNKIREILNYNSPENYEVKYTVVVIDNEYNYHSAAFNEYNEAEIYASSLYKRYKQNNISASIYVNGFLHSNTNI